MLKIDDSANSYKFIGSGYKPIFKLKFLVLALVALLGLAVWSKTLSKPSGGNFHQKAIAILSHPQGDTPVKGIIEFEQTNWSGPVLIRGKISNLDPNGDRGFHIHEFGDLSNGCDSTGTHFNPSGKPRMHGAPEDRIRHVGDLGNISTNTSGITSFDFSDKVISLNGKHSIIGRAVVVHAQKDDLGKGGNKASLENGNAGARVACGVIGLQTSN